MLRIAFFLLFLVVALASMGLAASYEIVRVVEVGRATWTPLEFPLKFSPNGSQLAFFHGATLNVSDTLGNSREVLTLEMRPHLYEWLTEKEIVVWEYRSRGPSEYRRIIKVDLTTGSTKLLREYTRPPLGQRATGACVSGPHKTLEGNVYLRLDSSNIVSYEFPESDYDEYKKVIRKEDNHMVRWGEDGLYVNSADLSSNVRKAMKPHSNMPIPPACDPGLNYAVNGGTIVSIADDRLIVMDTMIAEVPSGAAGCGFEYSSCNPRQPEILFNLTCYGPDEHKVDIVRDMVGVYHIERNEMVIFNDVLNMENCGAPSYGPEGRKIAFLSGRSAYILLREER